VEMCDLEDVKKTIALLVAFVENVQKDDAFGIKL
jgi:putative aminopeptidase FrvX